jgi:hypothetical protein
MRRRQRKPLPGPPPTPEGMVWARQLLVPVLVPASAWHEAAQERMDMNEGVSFRTMDTGRDYDLAQRRRRTKQ